MRIIGGKYLNWVSEAYQTGHGDEDGDGQGEGRRYDTTWKYTLVSVMLMFRASCDLEVKNTPPGSPTGIVFR
jgi:hypothetical protein